VAASVASLQAQHDSAASLSGRSDRSDGSGGGGESDGNGGWEVDPREVMAVGKPTAPAPSPSLPQPPDWCAVQLLLDMPWRRFATPAVQGYFVRELAEELDVPESRLRVADFHRPTGAVTVRILGAGQHLVGAPPPPSAEALAARLQLVIAANALCLDPGFGSIAFLARFTAAEAQAEAQAAAEAAMAGRPVPRSLARPAAYFAHPSAPLPQQHAPLAPPSVLLRAAAAPPLPFAGL
jgi:hypothetical protein